jgi:hypothetical protein
LKRRRRHKKEIGICHTENETQWNKRKQEQIIQLAFFVCFSMNIINQINKTHTIATLTPATCTW